ncbi:type I restriction-modification system subunit M/S [Streptomyces sp. NBC_00094]|uniref:type I restriction-modification system subunit M/S n=1 Tax=Streptomyces sp. NBC_00094 TaxID=2903620 RepID=UPI002250654C|nr:type I restriction-modification system subunit M/S [Streptomyces sp. NBC_00094]MCX5393725.1 N-6 DNA methylase [Streptomyces sp. NBC_00094]
MSYPKTDVDPLLGRAQLAALAGVSRPTVTAWERQEIGFPSPRRSNGQDYFRWSEIVDWLDRRTVPPGRLVDGEPVGTTYGDRARTRAGAGRSVAGAADRRPGAGSSYHVPTSTVDEPRPESRRIVTDLMGGLVDRVRGAASVLDYLNLLLCLHYLRGADPACFDALAARARSLRNLDEAAQLLRDIGRAADEDMRGRGVHSSMQEALRHLEPRTARDLRNVVDAMSCLTEDVFGLILDEYERQAALGSGEFFTPRSVVRLMTQLICSEFGPGEPESVYDPYARDGGFLIEASAFCALDGDGLPHGKTPQTYGETRRGDTWRLATMNLLLHGVSPSLDLKRTVPWHDSLERTSREAFDIVLTNPPFNMSDPGRGERPQGRWAYGAPPVDNDNFAWVQHCLAKLSERGRAGIIMPNKAGNSGHKADRTIRGNLVERGCVECVIALPAQLFTGTAVPVSVWILRHPDDRRDKTLFLDARHMGEKKGSRRVLSAMDVDSLLAAYRAHRSTEGNAPHVGATYTEWRVPSALVSREELRRSDYSLNPLDHVERQSDGGDDYEYELVSAWERLSDAEERLRAVQDSVTRAPFAGDRGGSLPRAGRSAPRFDLGSVCEIQAGPSYTKLGKKQRSADGLVPVVFPRHLKDRRVSDDADERVTDETAHRLRNFELWDKDIVCVRSGAITQPALVRQHQIGWLMSPNVIRLRVTERHAHQVLPEYLFHYLCLDESVTWMRDRAAATAAPSLRSESLGSLRIPLPALAEQREIVAALDGLDELDRAHLAVAVSARRTRTALAGALLGS